MAVRVSPRFTLLFMLTLVGLFSLAAAPLAAQGSLDLSESSSVIVGELTLEISYPEGWIADTDEDAIYIATSLQALNEIKGADRDVPPTEVAITLATPSFLPAFGLPLTADPVDALELYLELVEMEGEIETISQLQVPAAGVFPTSSTSDLEMVAIALAFPGGTVIVEAFTGGQDNIVAEIIRSITLTGSLANSEATVLTLRQPNGNFEFSLNVPPDWFQDYDESGGLLYIGNTEETLEKVRLPDSSFGEGELGITIGLPSLLELFDLPIDASPEQTIARYMELIGTESDILTDHTLGLPVAYATVTGENVPEGGGDLIALGYDAGTVLIAIQPSGAGDDSLFNMILSITFDGQRGVFDAETTTTSDLPEAINQWASSADGSSQYGATSWSFDQATGEPNTFECGDKTTAWAAFRGTSREYLILTYDEPVIPTQINIYQTYNPGAIVAVDVGNSDNPDAVLTLPDSDDPPGNTDCPGVFSVDVSGVDVPIDTVILYLDQSLTGSWNEIDAVELVGVPAE